jgi:hypothetical protein
LGEKVSDPQDRPNTKTMVWPLVVGGLIAIITGAIGALVTHYLDHGAWLSAVDYQQRAAVLQKRLDLIERTAQLAGKAPGMDDVWQAYLKEIPTSVKKGVEPLHDPALASKLGEYNGEFQATLTLDALFFGPKTQAEIAELKGTPGPLPYWKIPPERMNRLISAMAAELHAPPVEQEAEKSAK